MSLFKNLFNDKKLVSEDRQERPVETKDIKNDANSEINKEDNITYEPCEQSTDLNSYNDEDYECNDEGEEMNNYKDEEEVVIPPIIDLPQAIVCTCDEGETKVAIKKDRILFMEENENAIDYKKKNTEIYFDDSTGEECSVTVDQSFDEVRRAVWGRTYEETKDLEDDTKELPTFGCFNGFND